MKLFSIPIIIISFIVGLGFVHFTAPPSRIVLVYPTPDNINSIQFKDATDNCYSFQDNIIECPRDESKIHQIPVQN